MLRVGPCPAESSPMRRGLKVGERAKFFAQIARTRRIFPDEEGTESERD